MPSIVHQRDLEEFEHLEPDGYQFDQDFSFKVTSPEGTDEACSPDEVCDLILDMVEEQFWDWWTNPSRSRRFKPRLKVYEVLQ